MFPELTLRLGPEGTLVLNTYRTLGLAAVLVGLGLTAYRLHRQGLSRRELLILLGAAGAGFLAGARGFHALANPSLYPSPAMLFALEWGNFGLYGGILGAALAGLAAAKVLGRDPWRLGDLAVPGLAVAVALAKVGCYGNGCCFGVETQLPWGVTYPIGSLPASWGLVETLGNEGLFGLFGGARTVKPLHPVQLYEASGALLSAALALGTARRLRTPGTALLTFLLAFSAVRLAAWHLRVAPPSWALGAHFYDALYGLMMVGALGLMIFRSLRGGNSDDGDPN